LSLILLNSAVSRSQNLSSAFDLYQHDPFDLAEDNNVLLIHDATGAQMPKSDQNISADNQKLSELEAAKERLLKKIVDKLGADPKSGEVFGAYHTSHSSYSKHNSTTS
jgi:hypothetical protein